MPSIIEEFRNNDYFGLETILNLSKCDKDIIKDENALKEFITSLCKEIDMNPVGEPVLKRFGAGRLYGYSLMQLIETSSIVAHFSEETRDAYIDIFSCKEFDPESAAVFCAKYFGAVKVQYSTTIRDVNYSRRG